MGLFWLVHSQHEPGQSITTSMPHAMLACVKESSCPTACWVPPTPTAPGEQRAKSSLYTNKTPNVRHQPYPQCYRCQMISLVNRIWFSFNGEWGFVTEAILEDSLVTSLPDMSQLWPSVEVELMCQTDSQLLFNIYRLT